MLAVVSVEDYTEKQRRSAQRVLDQMERTNTRTESVYNHVRTHERKCVRMVLLVCLITEETPIASPENPTCFKVFSYNISQGGVGFISPEEITCKDVAVGVPLPNSTIRWFQGRVVRSREITEENFWEYGVAFKVAPKD